MKFLMSISSAINIIYGGVNINAFPEKVILKINHRVSYEPSLDEVKRKISGLASILASDFNLNLDDYGETLTKNVNAKGNFRIQF